MAIIPLEYELRHSTIPLSGKLDRMGVMGKYTHWLQAPGLGLEIAGGAAMNIWPDDLWIAYFCFALGLVLIFWPLVTKAKNLRIRSPFYYSSIPPKETEADAGYLGTSKHNVWLVEAVHYTVFRNWEARKVNLSDNQKLNELYENQKHIRQLASDGDLPIWGMNNFSGPSVLIPAEYWKRYNFDFMGALKHTEHPEEWKTVNTRPPDDSPSYHSLKTSKETIEKFFPTEQQQFEQVFDDD